MDLLINKVDFKNRDKLIQIVNLKIKNTTNLILTCTISFGYKKDIFYIIFSSLILSNSFNKEIVMFGTLIYKILYYSLNQYNGLKNVYEYSLTLDIILI